MIWVAGRTIRIAFGDKEPAACASLAVCIFLRLIVVLPAQ